MSDSSHDRSPMLGGQRRPGSGDEPGLTGDRALLHLVEMLSAPDEESRLSAVFALAALGDERAIEHLVSIMSDIGKERQERFRSVIALANYGLKAIPHFIALMQYDDVISWDMGTLGLGRIAHDNAMLSGRATRALIRILGQGNDLQRRIAAERIKSLARDSRLHRALPALLRALDDEYDMVRANVYLALRDLQDRRAVPKLLSVLHGSDGRVETGAVEALGSIGDRRAVRDIIAVLEGDDEVAWGGAAYALGSIGDPRAVPALAKVARDPGKSIFLRRLCIEALGMFNSPEPVAELIALTRDRGIPGEIRFRAPEGLLKLGDETTYPVLIEAIGDPNIQVRGNAIFAIEYLARRLGIETVPRDAVEAIIPCLADTTVVIEGTPPYTEDTTIRSRAVDALSAIWTPEVAAILEEWRQAHAPPQPPDAGE